jgi:hypothetical protein
MDDLIAIGVGIGIFVLFLVCIVGAGKFLNELLESDDPWKH